MYWTRASTAGLFQKPAIFFSRTRRHAGIDRNFLFHCYWDPCPQCGAVRRAWEMLVDLGPVLVPSQPKRGKCPACDFVGPLRRFPIAERPAEQEETS
jgi:hypothetical protein